MPHPLDTQLSTTEEIAKARNLSLRTILWAIMGAATIAMLPFVA